jgi:coatomer subunit beta'
LDEASTLTTDMDHKFELSVLLGRVDDALKCAHELKSVEKWKSLGDLALKNWNVYYPTFVLFLVCCCWRML